MEWSVPVPFATKDKGDMIAPEILLAILPRAGDMAVTSAHHSRRRAHDASRRFSKLVKKATIHGQRHGSSVLVQYLG